MIRKLRQHPANCPLDYEPREAIKTIRWRWLKRIGLILLVLLALYVIAVWVVANFFDYDWY